MTDPEIRLRLDKLDGHYQPGKTLTVDLQVEPIRADNIRSLELSVLWYTSGKGEEDFAVWFFDRIVPEVNGNVAPEYHNRWTTTLPASPLSYEGRVVKVCWCVRARLFLPQGRELTCEVPIRLGNVSAPPGGDERAKDES